MKLKCAIFDIDGVVIHTAKMHYNAWKKVFLKYGKNFTFDEFKKTIDGMPRDKGAKFIFPEFSKEKINIIYKEKQKYFNEILKKEKAKVFYDAVKLIKHLRKNKIKIVIASSSKNAVPILKKLNLYKLFDIDAKGAYVKKGKPHPDIFLKAAKKLKMKPENCVVFEDSLNGVVAAKRAGMKCIAINRDRKSIKGADLIVKSFNNLKVNDIKKLFNKRD